MDGDGESLNRSLFIKNPGGFDNIQVLNVLATDFSDTHRASSSRNDDQWEFCNIDEKNYQHWVATERYTEDTVTANVTVYKLRSEK
ncbi:hypothetical protein I204_08488 [Kwoniella mangroviensis CBS 8886]|uniref:uncharacterized protein n=1 Tax=Kwoniella mangroviensis CBS 8507 TaxID=1296122 RepID=UPI00080CE627|nr:uncharacterized protein I203_01505 [Kwoniella mangroviensis CBS 8507]OCF69641.1 hypothetical protein I203_01505 [Kwoniella mangroviensis CBS 8507]OCF70858.1 hypothetical protein I204_08488 [Kwoniella mangroviensis CBS 8886]